MIISFLLYLEIYFILSPSVTNGMLGASCFLPNFDYKESWCFVCNLYSIDIKDTLLMFVYILLIVYI